MLHCGAFRAAGAVLKIMHGLGFGCISGVVQLVVFVCHAAVAASTVTL